MKFFITDDDMCTTQKLNLARVQKWIESNGGNIVDNADVADHILCMTCNGWSLLEENSYSRINKYKKNYADKMIVVGCVNDAHPEKVKKIWSGRTVRTRSDEDFSFSEIQGLFPNFSKKIKEIPAQSVFRRKEDYRDYNLSKRFINIAEGCAFNCTFCTHKPGLGNRRSRTLNDILTQIDECVAEGVKIVNLMGMETSMWGIEFKLDYADLLQSVINFSNSYEIHMAQFNAHGFDRYAKKLLPLLKNPRVTDIQAPIQSTSNRILKMMKRRLHSEGLGDFFREVKKFNKRVVLRTDLIIGWPTETPEERIESLKFAGEIFDEIALYSIELSPDLPAWKYIDDAFSASELSQIHKDSLEYLKSNFPDVVVHSGQQDDATMANIESQRQKLRMSKQSFTIESSTK